MAFGLPKRVMNTTNTPDRDEVIANLKRWAKDWHPKNALLESALTLLERDMEDGSAAGRLSPQECNQGDWFPDNGKFGAVEWMLIPDKGNPHSFRRFVRQKIEGTIWQPEVTVWRCVSTEATTTEKGEG